MMNTNGLFPIKMEPACKLKWAWSTIHLYNGTTNSCHRCKLHPIEIENFNFHNTPEKLSQRKTMLSGEWPIGIGCEFCKNIEDSGGVSDRIFQKKIPGYPIELVDSSTEMSVTPSTIEVYFDNKCNLSCVYCIPKFSSKIQAEVNKYGDFPIKTMHRSYNKVTAKTMDIFPKCDKHSEYDIIKQKFWSWMKENSHKLLRFHILGGEPFFQNDINDIISFFDNHPRNNLELNIISNLTINPKIFSTYINQFKQLFNDNKIKRLDITCSIDCWGIEQEYVRYGINLKWFEQNMQYMLNQNDWLRININQTINVLTIKSIPLLMDKINQWKTQKNIAQYMGFITYWDFLHPRIFDYEFWKPSFDETKEIMMADNWDDKQSIDILDGIVRFLQKNALDDKNHQENMKLYLDELDRRRGTDWRATFPYLDI